MDNFYDTAVRMSNTSEILHNNRDYHNSCYMAGYVIECYAKIFVEKYTVIPPKKFSHDVNKLDIELKNILGGNSSLSIYIVDGSMDFINICRDWNPLSLRYESQINELNDSISSCFQTEKNLAMKKISKMKIDGII